MMKIMAFGDIHEYLHPLALLAEPLQQANVVLVTGDMTRWRGPETATKVLQAIMAYNPNVLAQVGNTDSWDIHHYLTQCGMNLHGQGHRFGEVGIFGVGGSNYTPFYTPTEFSEEEIADYLLAGYDMIKEARYKILSRTVPRIRRQSTAFTPARMWAVTVCAGLSKPISRTSASLVIFMRRRVKMLLAAHTLSTLACWPRVDM